MRTLIYTLGLVVFANAFVTAQTSNLALSSLPQKQGRSVTDGTTRTALRTAMPVVRYYSIAEGEDENFPPGLYATFLPSAPDTVNVYDATTATYVTIKTQPGKEIIHGDSASVMREVKCRRDLYDGTGSLPEKFGSFVSRSGFVPISQFGSNRTRFAIKPSNFRITPNAEISASVQLEEGADMRLPLCMVSHIDYEHNTFTVEIAKNVPVGEAINWVIINYPE